MMGTLDSADIGGGVKSGSLIELVLERKKNGGIGNVVFEDGTAEQVPEGGRS
jgi:hypothetical protein